MRAARVTGGGGGGGGGRGGRLSSAAWRGAPRRASLVPVVGSAAE